MRRLGEFLIVLLCVTGLFTLAVALVAVTYQAGACS